MADEPDRSAIASSCCTRGCAEDLRDPEFAREFLLAAVEEGIAAADTAPKLDVEPGLDTTGDLSSHRGVAQDYLVLPSGGELTGQMRFVTAQPVFAEEPVRFSDLALFSLAGRWSLLEKLEVSGAVDLLPKQPSYTKEKPWQSVGAGLRSPLGEHVAIAINGAGGHLIKHTGMWTREAVSLEWRKPIAEVLTFDVQGSVDGITLSAPSKSTALMTEVGVSTSALFREPTGHWGGWVGISYAIPVTRRGNDPTTDMAMDPQPRLDFRVGSVLSLAKQWDLFAELAVIDRGDLKDPTTRLPILDGGFDQLQIMFGVTRHITAKRPTHRHVDDTDVLQMGTR